MPDTPGGWREELLTAYDAQLRADAEVVGAEIWDHVGPLWRAVYRHGGFVSYESLEGLGDVAAVDALIAETIAYFEGFPQVEEFEWKTRGHDWPPDLDQRLRAHGLVPEEVETVMIGEATRLAVDVHIPDGVAVRRIDLVPDRDRIVGEAAEMQREVFGDGPSAEDVLARLDLMDGLDEFWVAEVDGRVISAGRLTRVAGTEFAGLWGGATVPRWRQRGVYRALTAARARSAIASGVRYLHSDCTAMSRPILERSGLVAVTTTTPYKWHRGG
ncbi:MAG: GNAT family N-acetyltransferase [Nocardioidaceae bacterium]